MQPHITEGFKKAAKLISKVQIGSRKIFIDLDERWIVRQVKAKPGLNAPKLVNEIEKHLQKNVNPDEIVLRKYQFNGRVA